MVCLATVGLVNVAPSRGPLRWSQAEDRSGSGQAKFSSLYEEELLAQSQKAKLLEEQIRREQ